MSRTTMFDDVPVEPITSVAVMNRGAELAPRAIETLVDLPPHRWAPTLLAHPEWLTLSTLRGLLIVAHDDLDREPKRSARIAKFVLRMLPRVELPRNARILSITIEGTAWKEYGNALRIAGRQRPALTAANRAIKLFSMSPGLHIDRAAATVLKAHTLHDLNQTSRALRLLDEAAAIFATAREERRQLQTVILRGIFLFERKNYADASETFDSAFVLAQRVGDPRELARMYNNRGICAMQRGDAVAAWDLLLHAAAAFAELGMDAELPRAQWGLARLMHARTNVDETLHDLHSIHTAFQRRGMLVEAATVLLEIATILSNEPASRDKARTLCTRLVMLFHETQMPQEAIAALADLRRDALAEDDLLASGITETRNYFRNLRTQPPQPFVPGH